MFGLIGKIMCLFNYHKFGNAKEESFYTLRWECTRPGCKVYTNDQTYKKLKRKS